MQCKCRGGTATIWQSFLQERSPAEHLVHVHGERDIVLRIRRSAEGNVLVVVTIDVGLRV